MTLHNFPFANDELDAFVPPIDVAFVYEVCPDYSCMCTVRIHNQWYKQRIVLRNIMPLQHTPNVDESRKLFELMQDLLSFRNVYLCNVSYGDGGALLADVEVAGLHINGEINSCVGDINREGQRRYEASMVGKMVRWWREVVKRWRGRCFHSNKSQSYK